MIKSPNRNAVISAIDHGLHHGIFEYFEDPEETLRTVLDAGTDGILAGIPFIRQYADILASYPDVQIVATIDHVTNSTFPGEDEGSEIHQQVFSVDEATRIGADAIKSALVFGREDPNVLKENIRFVSEASERARQLGIPSVVEPTLWGNRAEDELDAQRLWNANRIGFELGADVLKSPYPGDPDLFEPIVSNTPLPVYIAGGPAMDNDEAVLEMVKGAMDVGGNGVMLGRNIWQRDDPASMIRAIDRIVHHDVSVSDAATEL